ncbi:FERM domain-containing protein 6-like isoform X2 [Scyliorhinus torazame]|uniref:FERM domain-containing protein 6-like isoform X2 n=1 Tax=Scyliorhinus torazame TaxID=75743 RepID=UPI003B5CD4B9
MNKQLFQNKMMPGQRIVFVLLPNKEQLEVLVGVKATGQDLYDQVCDMLKIRDGHFFGLSMVQNNEHIFIDLEQKLTKYFPKEWKKEISKNNEMFGAPFVVCLRVQYYVENGKVISDKKARHFYYCQLKEQVLSSRCTSKEEVYFLLAAYALQADLGNYKKHVHVGKYFEPPHYFPQWDKKEERPSVVLGLTLKGMHIYQESQSVRQLLYDFPWSNIGKLTFLGKKFEIQPDGLPSARKLIYYTGCPFRSRHLLQLLSSSHRLYMNIQPVLKQIRKIEEMEEKKRYRESYISDAFEMDLERLDEHSYGSGSSQGSVRNKQLSRHSTVSHGSSHTSGIEADSRHRMSVEMAVDEPFSTEPVHSTVKYCSLTISRRSSHTSGIESSSKDRTDDDEVEVPVDDPLETSQENDIIEGESVDYPILKQDYWQDITNDTTVSLSDPSVNLRGQSVHSLSQATRSKPRNSTDRHSQSLDDVRLYQQQPPLGYTLSSDNSQSYTFGCIYEDKDSQFCYTYSTADCKTKSTFYGKRSMNCLSLDLLGEEQQVEFVV